VIHSCIPLLPTGRTGSRCTRALTQVSFEAQGIALFDEPGREYDQNDISLAPIVRGLVEPGTDLTMANFQLLDQANYQHSMDEVVVVLSAAHGASRIIWHPIGKALWIREQLVLVMQIPLISSCITQWWNVSQPTQYRSKQLAPILRKKACVKRTILPCHGWRHPTGAILEQSFG
jgi:hypothetical protein